jgi:hypothetical protein
MDLWVSYGEQRQIYGTQVAKFPITIAIHTDLQPTSLGHPMDFKWDLSIEAASMRLSL